MGAEQSTLLGYTGSGYTPVALDASEADQKHALATLLQRDAPIHGQGHGGALGYNDASPSPLSDLGNRLNMQEGLFTAEGAALQTGRKVSSGNIWKLPLPSWTGTTAPAKPKGLADLSGEKTPPLCEASLCSAPPQQSALEVAIKAAFSEKLGCKGNIADSPAERLTAPRQTTLALTQRNQAQNAARLERAVMDRDGALVRHLVHAESALLSHQTQDGFAAIHLAAAQGFPDMVSLLAVLGASLETGTRDDNNTPLHLAATAGRLNDGPRLECLELLLTLGACPDQPNKEGRSALHVAAMTGNIPALGSMLDAGADRAAMDKDGLRPVDVALNAGAAEAVQYLNLRDARAQANKLKKYQQWLS